MGWSGNSRDRCGRSNASVCVYSSNYYFSAFQPMKDGREICTKKCAVALFNDNGIDWLDLDLRKEIRAVRAVNDYWAPAPPHFQRRVVKVRGKDLLNPDDMRPVATGNSGQPVDVSR